MRDAPTEETMTQAQGSLYFAEHTGAWLVAIIAVIAAIVGVLAGFDVIDLRDDVPVTGAGEEGLTLLSSDFWDGAMLLFSAITAGLLAMALHSNDHHRMRELSIMRGSERAMWSFEHGFAYILAIGSIVAVVIGLLVGFNTFSADHDQGDALMWIWLGLTGSTLTTALHMVRHHQMAVEEDYIIGIVEDRVRRRIQPATTPQPGIQGR
jgi:ABC-type branched-subunit amino acid transport system permease subunit